MRQRRPVAPSPGQMEIDFDRGERLGLLDELPIESGQIQDGRATVRVSGATALAVLRVIEKYSWKFGKSWVSAETIATEIKRAERTARRAIRYLESIEYLVVERRTGCSPDCRINWGEISLKARHRNPGHFDTNPGHSDTNPGHCVRRSAKKRKQIAPPLSPTEPASTERAADAVPPSASQWKEVEEALSSILGDWRRAARAAQSAGVTPEYVIRLVEHYRRLGDRVGPGKLFWRIRNAHPSVAPTDGWGVDLPSERKPDRESSSMIAGRVIREGRKAGAEPERIRRVLRRRLVAAGYEPDAEVF